MNEQKRYRRLIEAIEFFSGRFDIEQIVDYAYEFTMSLLPVKKAVIWVDHSGVYQPIEYEGYDLDIQKNTHAFSHHHRHNEIIYFHAGLIYAEKIATFFPEITLKGDVILPLVMDKTLYGFILIELKEPDGFSEQDVLVAEALMNLFATALTHYKSYTDLEQIKGQLDEKVFNLFAVNQSTKALMRETNLNQLYELSVGVFAELTQSHFTTFFVYDEVSELFKLRGSRHVFDSEKNHLEMTLYPNKHDGATLPICIKTKDQNQIQKFKSYFINGETVLEALAPEYIVVLKKEAVVIGFVTLGAKVNEQPYENGVFELIESLASSTYIAINNAIYMTRIQEQKKLLENQIQELIRLNTLMGYVNGASNYEDIVALVMDTLSCHFGVTMGFFASLNHETNMWDLDGHIGLSEDGLAFKDHKQLQPLREGKLIILYDEASVTGLFQNTLEPAFQERPGGLILLPIYRRLEDDAYDLLGALGILATGDELVVSQVNLVKYESITMHLAPVIYQLKKMQQLKTAYKPDYKGLFRQQLIEEVATCDALAVDLYVVHLVQPDQNPLEEFTYFDQFLESYPRSYPIDNGNLFIMLNDKDQVQMLQQQGFNLKIEVYQYGRDFYNYEDFSRDLSY